MLLVWSEARKPTCHNLESILHTLSNRTSPSSWWVELRPPDLVSHLTFLDSSLTEYPKPERSLAPRSQWRLFSTRRVIWHRYYTLPVIVCSILHFFFFLSLAGSLRGVIIFSWEALVSQCPLTSLDAAVSCRFPSWPHHKWQTLTKPQVCAESSFWFVSSMLPLCVVCQVW